jgi:hypothetical protein
LPSTPAHPNCSALFRALAGATRTPTGKAKTRPARGKTDHQLNGMSFWLQILAYAASQA